MRSSVSDGFFRNRAQMSMVKIVEEELKIEVNELMRAASITASNKPESPTQNYSNGSGKSQWKFK